MRAAAWRHTFNGIRQKASASNVLSNRATNLLQEQPMGIGDMLQAQIDAEDAARWRALVASTGHETDMSSGPGKPKDMILRINCTGCARWLESGAVDWAA